MCQFVSPADYVRVTLPELEFAIGIRRNDAVIVIDQSLRRKALCDSPEETSDRTSIRLRTLQDRSFAAERVRKNFTSNKHVNAGTYRLRLASFAVSNLIPNGAIASIAPERASKNLIAVVNEVKKGDQHVR